ncbi:hypothetical protein WJX77_000694 [Trebouxia sp. C0004]
MLASSHDRDPASVESRKQKLRDLMAEETHKHEFKMKGWSDKLKELSTLGSSYGNQKSQQAYSVPYEQSQANGTSVHDQPEDSGDEYDASSSSSSSQGPPGFSSTVKGSQAPQKGHTPLSNGKYPTSAAQPGLQPQPDYSSTPAAASLTPQGSQSVFKRLGQTPPAMHQQADAHQLFKSQGTPHAASNELDPPPGFATRGPVTAQPMLHDQDLPPGFPPAGSLSAHQPSQRSGMRSDQASYSARSQDAAPRSASRAASSSSGPSPSSSGAPPGFAGLPAYLAQRLSPVPAQKPAGLPNQAAQNSSHEAATNSHHTAEDDSPDEPPPGFSRARSSSLPSRASGALKDRGSMAGPEGTSATALDDVPPGCGPTPKAASQRTPPGYGAQSARQAPAGGWAGGTSGNGAQPLSSTNGDVQGEEDFPRLAFSIRGLDQQHKFSSIESHQDYPSLGGPAGGEGGSKPAGAWGKGPGQLAGSLRQQQQQHQVSSVASSLAAAVLPPPPSTVHVERVELNDGLRVPGDDASDSVRRKRSKKHEFEKWERVKGMGSVNIVEGLELHQNVLSPEEQLKMVQTIEEWVIQGKQGQLRGRTFSAPRKWARGKGRITCQFGCCYNYAIDSEGRKPGIVAEEVVEKMPPVLVSLCKRLVRWGILPKHKEPDTAIINVYDVEDCIPPHVDHHDFDRPFCTISLLSEQHIMFGSKIISRGPGDFVCDFEMPLPTGSCLVLKGNGADVAQHCVPPVNARRMSITLRRMQDVHARRVVAMAERVHAGLPVDTNNPPSVPQRLTADDAYDMEERRESSLGSRRR